MQKFSVLFLSVDNALLKLSLGMTFDRNASFCMRKRMQIIVNFGLANKGVLRYNKGIKTRTVTKYENQRCNF